MMAVSRRVGRQRQRGGLVRGLAGLICPVYQDTAPADALAFRSRILPDLGLDRLLSPTRLRGLAAVEVRIQQLASA